MPFYPGEIVKPALIDTDIISHYLRNHPIVIKRFKEYLKEHHIVNFSIISYYEILSGLKYKDARKQLKSFQEFAENSRVLPVAESSIKISSEIYADLRRKGELIDDIDILIAGIALANNLVIVTHNASHFDRIEGLDVEDWAVA